ncbi:hypothetical protein KIPB_009161 [Kipferlia bialata]|uniref:Uncharacterized protein n=1 Tax=Kipferlia bialata TaxID=797122 RepID=A0A9K3D376_9EUKA|nr:hypothetical protein KIPB_009161 [Kipferlia bialata]|eukprot:g9161.t1
MFLFITLSLAPVLFYYLHDTIETLVEALPFSLTLSLEAEDEMPVLYPSALGLWAVVEPVRHQCVSRGVISMNFTFILAGVVLSAVPQVPILLFLTFWPLSTLSSGVAAVALIITGAQLAYLMWVVVISSRVAPSV